MTKPDIKQTELNGRKLYYTKSGDEFCAIPENIIKYIEYLEGNDYTDTMTVISEEHNSVDEITKLIYKFKEEKLPDAETPYHHEAETWAGMKKFIEWLDKKPGG